MASPTGTAVLITKGGKQFRLLLTVHFGAVENLLNLGELTIQKLVEQGHRIRIIGHLRVGRQRATRCLDVGDDSADFRASVIVSGEDLLEQASQLVIGARDRAAGLLIDAPRLIGALL